MKPIITLRLRYKTYYLFLAIYLNYVAIVGYRAFREIDFIVRGSKG